TWRCSRTACCAAAIDFGRPSVIGSTRPGNNTVLRTGTMMSASGGSGGRAPLPDPFFDSTSDSATAWPRFLQRDHQAARNDGAAHIAVAPGRQPKPPVETPLGQFEPMNGCSAPFLRHGTRAGDDEIAVLDHRLCIVGIDAGQRDERENLEFGFEKIDRRLPSRQPLLSARQPEQLA